MTVWGIAWRIWGERRRGQARYLRLACAACVLRLARTSTRLIRPHLPRQQVIEEVYFGAEVLFVIGLWARENHAWQ